MTIKYLYLFYKSDGSKMKKKYARVMSHPRCIYSLSVFKNKNHIRTASSKRKRNIKKKRKRRSIK